MKKNSLTSLIMNIARRPTIRQSGNELTQLGKTDTRMIAEWVNEMCTPVL